MGSPAAHEREDEVQVTIAEPFALGRFAFTRGEFAAFIAATGHEINGDRYRLTGTRLKRETGADWRSPGLTQNDRHPVVCVSWHDARAYAAWLSASTGRSYRLLSETEREYVTGAGSTTPFWWGARISTDLANYDGTIAYGSGVQGEWRKGTVPVDSFSARGWGLYNVHGNVWDWVDDCWNEKNAGNPGDGRPRYRGDCSLRVQRGASWNNATHTLRSARRERNPADFCSGITGFRVARTLRTR